MKAGMEERMEIGRMNVTMEIGIETGGPFLYLSVLAFGLHHVVVVRISEADLPSVPHMRL